MEIAENIASVKERIAAACRHSGRRVEDVRLVAVSKTVDAERIRQAYEAGMRDFGENRVQEASEKRPALADLDATWHLIGHLQTNKARRARELFGWIHSIDSLRLAQKVDQAAMPSQNQPDAQVGIQAATHGQHQPVIPAKAGIQAATTEQGTAPGEHRLPVLLEVNLGEEASKFGAQEAEIVELARRVSELATLELRGLMVIPPFFEDAERVRPFFRRLRELAHVIDSAGLPGARMRELSMGMSHDFEIAIEEGATIVRAGTAIFGSRA